MQKKSKNKRTPVVRRARLDIEIQFLEGIVRRDPEYVEALQVLGDDYTEHGRLADGLAIDERLVKLCPSDPLVHYNLACSYSLTEQVELAAAALDAALELGYRDLQWLRRDPDLKELRAHPAYRKICAKLATLQNGKNQR